jgi:hypothetical protein
MKGHNIFQDLGHQKVSEGEGQVVHVKLVGNAYRFKLGLMTYFVVISKLFFFFFF